MFTLDVGVGRASRREGLGAPYIIQQEVRRGEGRRGLMVARERRGEEDGGREERVGGRRGKRRGEGIGKERGEEMRV